MLTMHCEQDNVAISHNTSNAADDSNNSNNENGDSVRQSWQLAGAFEWGLTNKEHRTLQQLQRCKMHRSDAREATTAYCAHATCVPKAARQLQSNMLVVKITAEGKHGNWNPQVLRFNHVFAKASKSMHVGVLQLMKLCVQC